MLLLRALGLLLVLAMGVSAGLGLLTRQPHFFRWARTLFIYGLVVLVVMVIVFVLERLLVTVV